MRITVGDVSLAIDIQGPPAGDALLLIHGHPFNRSMWQPQLAPAAAEGWRVIAPDLRGYGGSSVVDGPGRFENFAHDLLGLLDALGIEAAVVGGLSMGGQIAMELCRQRPDRVRGLLLAATFPQAETPEGAARRHAMADRLLNEGMHAYARDVLPKMVGSRCLQDRPEIGERVLGMMEGTDPRGAAAALRARAGRAPFEPVLARFRRPAAVVVGDDDKFTTRADADAMASLLADVELHWLPQVGHMPNLEEPASFNAAMLSLLARVRRSPAHGPA